MKNRIILRKILAVIGTAVVLTPYVFMIITSIIAYVKMNIFRIDYLMPAEIAPLMILGALMIFWSALLSKYRIKLIVLTIAAAMILLAVSMIVAAVSGLASGNVQPRGAVWSIVITSLILYDIIIACIGIEGIMLIKKLFKKN